MSLSAFFDELEQYLRQFCSNSSRNGDPGDARIPEGGAFWHRRSEGALLLDPDEVIAHAEMLSSACNAIAPNDDLSESAIQSAIQDAIYAVVDIPKSRPRDLEERIDLAMSKFRAFVEKPGQEFECWIEIAGLDSEDLPTKFGNTELVELGEEDMSNLADTVVAKHTVDQTGKLVSIGRMASELVGRLVAVQRVIARDQIAAMPLALREVGITLECLNFFADLIPYNRARLWIPEGQIHSGSSLRFSIAEDGSFQHSPKVKFEWKYSVTKLRELTGIDAESLSRVESLLCMANRNPVEELLLRGARWVGRAAAADSLEDGFLYAMIALECVVLPKRESKVFKKLSRRLARILELEGDREREFKCRLRDLYDLRSDLVHDGSLEISENDRAYLQRVALVVVERLLNRSEIAHISSLEELRDQLESG